MFDKHNRRKDHDVFLIKKSTEVITDELLNGRIITQQKEATLIILINYYIDYIVIYLESKLTTVVVHSAGMHQTQNISHNLGFQNLVIKNRENMEGKKKERKRGKKEKLKGKKELGGNK